MLAGLAFTDFATGLITQPFHVAMKLIYQADPQLKPVVSTPAFLIVAAIAKASTMYLTPITVSIITIMSIERWLHMTRRSWFTVLRVC